MTIVAGIRYGVHGTGTYQDYSPGWCRSAAPRSSACRPCSSRPWWSRCSSPSSSPAASSVGRCWPAAATRSPPALGDLERPLGRRRPRPLRLLAGIAGVLVVALSGSVNASIGDDLLLPSFAAPIIGGVALAGGVVSVLGTCLAAFIVRLVDVAQAQYNINPRWVDLVVGAVVLGAVLVSQKRVKEGSS